MNSSFVMRLNPIVNEKPNVGMRGRGHMYSTQRVHSPTSTVVSIHTKNLKEAQRSLSQG